MIVVDASALYELVADGRHASAVEARLAGETDQFAPHLVDAEVVGTIRRHVLRGQLDDTASLLAVRTLRDWPGERWSHSFLLDRVWELRHGVRSWDGFYVALAEIIGAPLLTLDRRLAGVRGLRCEIEVVGEI